jgi:hypothetical protein
MIALQVRVDWLWPAGAFESDDEGSEGIMFTKRRTHESVTESNGSGWKWIEDQGAFFWWDGSRYTSRAEWDGANWKIYAIASIADPTAWPADSFAESTPTPERKPWRTSKNWGIVLGFACVLFACATFLIPQAHDYFCVVQGGSSRGALKYGLESWGLVLMLLPLVSLGVAIWRLVVRDTAGYAWLMVSASSVFLFVMVAGRAVCDS